MLDYRAPPGRVVAVRSWRDDHDRRPARCDALPRKYPPPSWPTAYSHEVRESICGWIGNLQMEQLAYGA